MNKLFSIMLVFVFLLFVGCTTDDMSIKKANDYEYTYDKEFEYNYIDKENTFKFENAKRLNIEEKKGIEINTEGANIETRYGIPEGYERVKVEENSFAQYLRSKKLKPYGYKALYYNGRAKSLNNIYDSVYDYDIGNNDLHQAADAIMFLRADFLFLNGMYNDITFSFMNGFKAEYSKWMAGYRIMVRDNEASWHMDTEYNCTYESFLKYMNMIYSYCSALSLDKDLTPINICEMEIGDVFLTSGVPNHTVIIVDMAVNINTGEKIFILAQSGNPAQQTQILINPNNPEISPWYELNTVSELVTPEWTFSVDDIKRFHSEQ